MKNECNECEGVGYIIVEDNVHDVMVREKCLPCLHHEKQQEELFHEMRILLSSLSPQMLAHHLSKVIIKIAQDKHSEDAIREQLISKNKTGLLSWTTCM
jgi:hypothetical protein